MAQPHNDHDRQAIVWLDQFSRELEADPDLLGVMPIEEVREELQDLGADSEEFHAKLARTLRGAKLNKLGTTLLHWASPLWQPQWAGQFVGAGDIPVQTHTFSWEQGTIEVRCSWQPQSGATPAYLDLSWRADTGLEGAFWCRFVQPETQVVLAEVLLGRAREGGKYFTQQELGFNPSQEAWALVILVKSPES
jgi:hypothetical protein